VCWICEECSVARSVSLLFRKFWEARPAHTIWSLWVPDLGLTHKPRNLPRQHGLMFSDYNRYLILFQTMIFLRTFFAKVVDPNIWPLANRNDLRRGNQLLKATIYSRWNWWSGECFAVNNVGGLLLIPPGIKVVDIIRIHIPTFSSVIDVPLALSLGLCKHVLRQAGWCSSHPSKHNHLHDAGQSMTEMSQPPGCNEHSICQQVWLQWHQRWPPQRWQKLPQQRDVIIASVNS